MDMSDFGFSDLLRFMYIGPFAVLKCIIVGPETKKIAVLGPAYSGKTELWYGLQNKQRSTVETTSKSGIERFMLGMKWDFTPVYVESTEDIGGSNNFVSLYDKLVTEGTFVYFVLDITMIGSAEYKEQPLAQFMKILSNLKKLENQNGAGVKILATHIDAYSGDRTQAEKLVRDYFAPLEKYGVDCAELNVKLVNLKNASDIKEIREEVLKSLN